MADKNANNKAELDRLAVLYLSTKNVDVFVEMMEAGRAIIRSVFQKYDMSFVTWTYEDLFSEVYMRLKDAFDRKVFDITKGNCSTYIFMTARGAMLTHLDVCQNHKNKILAESVSDHAVDDGTSLSDFAAATRYTDDTLETMIEIEHKQKILYYLSERLSIFEQMVLIYFLKGYSYSDSAEKIKEVIKNNKDIRTVFIDQKVNTKAVDNALVRVKKKAVELVDDGLFDE